MEDDEVTRMTCDRCGQPLPDIDPPVRLVDALLPELIIHSRCAYDSEYANGAVQAMDTASTTR